MRVPITGTGKVLLSDASLGAVGRVLVQIPAATSATIAFVGRPRVQNEVGTELYTASDDVTLGYYTPSSDTLATAAITSGQVHVKADGNTVYANVTVTTATAQAPQYLIVVPLAG